MDNTIQDTPQAVYNFYYRSTLDDVRNMRGRMRDEDVINECNKRSGRLLNPSFLSRAVKGLWNTIKSFGNWLTTTLGNLVIPGSGQRAMINGEKDAAIKAEIDAAKLQGQLKGYETAIDEIQKGEEVHYRTEDLKVNKESKDRGTFYNEEAEEQKEEQEKGQIENEKNKEKDETREASTQEQIASKTPILLAECTKLQDTYKQGLQEFIGDQLGIDAGHVVVTNTDDGHMFVALNVSNDDKVYEQMSMEMDRNGNVVKETEASKALQTAVLYYTSNVYHSLGIGENASVKGTMLRQGEFKQMRDSALKGEKAEITKCGQTVTIQKAKDKTEQGKPLYEVTVNGKAVTDKNGKDIILSEEDLKNSNYMIKGNNSILAQVRRETEGRKSPEDFQYVNEKGKSVTYRQMTYDTGMFKGFDEQMRYLRESVASEYTAENGRYAEERESERTSLYTVDRNKVRKNVENNLTAFADREGKPEKRRSATRMIGGHMLYMNTDKQNHISSVILDEKEIYTGDYDYKTGQNSAEPLTKEGLQEISDKIAEQITNKEYHAEILGVDKELVTIVNERENEIKAPEQNEINENRNEINVDEIINSDEVMEAYETSDKANETEQNADGRIWVEPEEELGQETVKELQSERYTDEQIEAIAYGHQLGVPAERICEEFEPGESAENMYNFALAEWGREISEVSETNENIDRTTEEHEKDDDDIEHDAA